jgi:KRAB domain-containing zinc finger protein
MLVHGNPSIFHSILAILTIDHHYPHNFQECDHCGKTFFKKYQLRTHLFSVHIYENAEPTFKCSFESCDKAYVNEARLKHHIKYTHLETKLICEYCTKTFSRRDALEEHTKIHTRKPEDRFKCEICGHFIADIKTFKKHVKNHATESLDNSCHYCGKKSPNLNALKRHIKYVHETAPTHHCK